MRYYTTGPKTEAEIAAHKAECALYKAQQERNAEIIEKLDPSVDSLTRVIRQGMPVKNSERLIKFLTEKNEKEKIGKEQAEKEALKSKKASDLDDAFGSLICFSLLMAAATFCHYAGVFTAIGNHFDQLDLFFKQLFAGHQVKF